MEEVKYILSKGIERGKLEISNMEERIKDFDSFYKKMVREEIKEDSFESVEDIAGLTAMHGAIRKTRTSSTATLFLIFTFTRMCFLVD